MRPAAEVAPTSARYHARILTPVCMAADFDGNRDVEPLNLPLFRRTHAGGDATADFNLDGEVDEASCPAFRGAVRACAQP